MQTNGNGHELTGERAAIYARKSTLQSELHESEKSIPHQLKECRALIANKGWTEAEEHIYTEREGTSGALFGESRPELVRLLEAVKSTPRPFDILVVHAEDRLGRDVIETSYLVKQILDAGVQLFFSDGRERRLDTAQDALMMSITAFGGQFEREQASVRSRSKMRAKANDGHATGTTPFGYRRVAVNSHKEEVPDPTEVEIVRHVFRMRGDEGLGYSRIAHRLAVEYPGLRKWSVAGVRDLLANQIYIGLKVYGKTSLVIKKGKKVRDRNTTWVTKEMPQLAIIDPALWERAQARKTQGTSIYLRGRRGQLNGKPEVGGTSQHLLAGFCKCECGANLVVASASSDRVKFRYLVCWRHRSGGDAVCKNSRHVPLAPLTEAIIEQFMNVLTPEALAKAQAEIAADVKGSPEETAAQRAKLEGDIKKHEARAARLVDAIADGGDSKTLTAGLKKEEAEVEAAKRRIRQLDDTRAAFAQLTEEGRDEQLAALLGDVRGALQGAPVVARQILRKLLDGPIRVFSWTDETGKVVDSYWAKGTYGKALAGALGTGWNAYIPTEGTGRRDDLGPELKQLIETFRNSRDRGGPTS